MFWFVAELVYIYADIREQLYVYMISHFGNCILRLEFLIQENIILSWMNHLY